MRRALVLVVVVACTLGVAAPAVAQRTSRGATRASRPRTRADELLAALTFDQKVAIALGDYASVASFGVPALTSADGPSGIRADGTTSFPSSQTLAATFDRGARARLRRGDRAPRRAARASTGGSGRRWTSRARRSPGASPRTSARTRSSPARPWRQEVGGAKAAPRHRDAQALRRQQPGVRSASGSRLPPDGAARSPGLNVHRRPSARCRRSTRRRSSAAIRAAGADAVMCSYNRVNGPQTCESPALLGDLKASGLRRLRRPRLHLRRARPAGRHARRRRRPGARRAAGGRTAEMFTSGQVPQARLDDIVRRMLFAMFDSGVFDDPLGRAAADVQHARAPRRSPRACPRPGWSCSRTTAARCR